MTISGARTGTVGGAIPFGGYVVSMERLNEIRSVDKEAMTATVEGGVILGDLQKAVMNCLESKGLLRMSEEALREALGNAIRERRKSQGMTLAQMASRANVSLGYLSQIELGKNSASIETLYRVCLGLGVKLSDLFQSLQMHW